MPTIKSIRILNAAENGTITGELLEQLLEDPVRQTDLNVILSYASQLRRITNFPAAMGPIASSTRAMNVVLGNDLAVDTLFKSAACWGQVNVSAPGMAAVAANAMRFARLVVNTTYAAQLADSEAGMTSVSANRTAFSIFMNNATACAAALASTNGMRAIAANAAAVNDLVNALGATVANATIASTVAMNALANSATARNTIGTTNPYINGATMPVAKLLVGLAGGNPASYANMAEVVADVNAMNAIAANPVCRDIIGTTGVAFTAVAGSSMAMAKYAAAIVSLNPAQYDSMVSLYTVPTDCDILFANSTVRGIIASSTPAISAFTSSEAATVKYALAMGGQYHVPFATMDAIITSGPRMTAVMGNATARSVFYASPFFCPNRERIYPFHLATVSGAGLVVPDLSGNNRNSTAVGTATLTANAANGYAVYTGSGAVGPTIPALSVSSNYAITVVLTITAAMQQGIIGVNTGGFVINASGNALLGTNVNLPVFASPTLTPAVPVNGSAYAILQYRHNGTKYYVRINNGAEVEGTAAVISLAGTVQLAAAAKVFGLNLRMAEMIITTNADAATELANIRTAMATKYNIAL